MLISGILQYFHFINHPGHHLTYSSAIHLFIYFLPLFHTENNPNYLIIKRGSSRILLAISKAELAPVEAKIEPGRRPVSEEQPASLSSVVSKTYLSTGRPIRYSSLFTMPPGPWYIHSNFSSFFLIYLEEKI